MREFEERYGRSGAGKALRVAFKGFSQDPGRTYSNIFQTSLQRYWRRPQFAFFSRQQLEKILEEQGLQIGAASDQATAAAMGKLKGVDYLVVGSLSNYRGATIAQAQLMRVEDGEVASSARVSVPSR